MLSIKPVEFHRKRKRKHGKGPENNRDWSVMFVMLKDGVIIHVFNHSVSPLHQLDMSVHKILRITLRKTPGSIHHTIFYSSCSLQQNFHLAKAVLDKISHFQFFVYLFLNWHLWFWHFDTTKIRCAPSKQTRLPL